MDPNAALAEIRELRRRAVRLQDAGRYGVPHSRLLADLAQRFDALDEWLCNSGFAPEDWRPLMFPQTQREAWKAANND